MFWKEKVRDLGGFRAEISPIVERVRAVAGDFLERAQKAQVDEATGALDAEETGDFGDASEVLLQRRLHLTCSRADTQKNNKQIKVAGLQQLQLRWLRYCTQEAIDFGTGGQRHQRIRYWT